MGRKGIIFGTIIIILSTGLGLGIAEIILGWHQTTIDSSSSMDPGLMEYDPVLGWVLAPSWEGKHHHYDFEVVYATNAWGFRGQFPANGPTRDKQRIAILGDSFTFGFGVEDNELFTELMNGRTPGHVFMNMGIPGYSTDQEYLLMQRKGSTFQPNHYLLIIYLGNDVLDIALPYPLQAEYAKPFFELTAFGDLVLRNTPVPREPKPPALARKSLGTILFGDELAERENRLIKVFTSSHLVQRLFPRRAHLEKPAIEEILERRLENNFQLMEVLLMSIKKEADRQGAGFSIALLAGRSFFSAPDSYSGIYQDFARRRILSISAKERLPVIDLAEGMRRHLAQTRQNQGLFHPHERHLNTLGHQVLAQLLINHFHEKD